MLGEGWWNICPFIIFYFVHLFFPESRHYRQLLEYLTASMRQLLQQQQKQPFACSLLEKVDGSQFGLPLKDWPAAVQLESQLDDPTTKKQLLMYLSKKTSSDITKSTYNIMATIFTNHCGTLFTWYGTAKKQSFVEHLPILKDLFYGNATIFSNLLSTCLR